MAHTKAENLADLAAELALVRALPGLREKSPGVFYWKSTPFLHFHDKEGVRWADGKRGRDWERIEIDFGAGRGERKRFVAKVRALHREISS